jgi:hypothetical protein
LRDYIFSFVDVALFDWHFFDLFLLTVRPSCLLQVELDVSGSAVAAPWVHTWSPQLAAHHWSGPTITGANTSTVV